MDSNDFINEHQKVIEVIDQYRGRSWQRYEEMRKKVVREEFAVGGELMNRGYYCPSLIEDIVVGNAHRGKILQRLTKRSKPTYQYGFDKDGNLLTVVSLSDDEECNRYEFIVRDGNCEIGIMFQKEWGLTAVSQCEYSSDGKLQSYTFFLWMIIHGNSSNLKKCIPIWTIGWLWTGMIL